LALEETIVRSEILLLAGALTWNAAAALAADLPAAAHPAGEAADAIEAASCDGEPCDAVARGLDAFLDRKLYGLRANGRSCADCHMPSDDFQLAPAHVEERFQALQERRKTNPRADDPLFRPIDADDFRTRGEEADDWSNLRQNGLVRVTLPLPANIRLIDPATGAPSTETTVDVWRSVPTVDNVALTGADGVNPWPRGPNPFGGYQLDARFPTLQAQARGALIDHAQIQNEPRPRLLDDLTSFQRVLFSSPRVRALAKAVRAHKQPLPDIDPPLNALQQAGKAVFVRACAHCHGGAGQSTTQAPVVRYHDIASQCPRPVDAAAPARFAFDPCPPRLARNARLFEITMPDGSKLRRPSSDPGRALLSGVVGVPGGPAILDDWNKFDVPGLRGIAHTAPYFHNNSAASLTEVIDHYIEFFKRVEAVAPPGVVPPVASTDGVHFDRRPTAAERAALLAYLRKL
jgi:cytochrome c peroxidase